MGFDQAALHQGLVVQKTETLQEDEKAARALTADDQELLSFIKCIVLYAVKVYRCTLN
jgi:hypothetical protein